MYNGQFFNPYMVGVPQPSNSFMPQNPQIQPQNAPVNTYAYVNGLEGAKAYIVPPNSKMLLMDSDNPIFYLKSANEAGQANIRTFRFEEVQNTPAPAPTVNYAKEEELNALNARIAKLEEALKNVNRAGNASVAGTTRNA